MKNITYSFQKPHLWSLRGRCAEMLIAATLCCACTQESLPPREPVTRSIISADTGAVTLTIDTAWVGEEHINF